MRSRHNMDVTPVVCYVSFSPDEVRGNANVEASRAEHGWGQS